MSLLARFRKPGGLQKLVELIESSDSKVRANILKNIRDEDPEFTAQVEEKLFFWDNLFDLDIMILTDIIAAANPTNLAAAIFMLEEDKKKIIDSCMNSQQKGKIKDEQELLKEPPKSVIASSRRKIVETARELQREGKITLKTGGASVRPVVAELADGKVPEAAGLATPNEEQEYNALKKKWDEIFAA